MERGPKGWEEGGSNGDTSPVGKPLLKERPGVCQDFFPKFGFMSRTESRNRYASRRYPNAVRTTRLRQRSPLHEAATPKPPITPLGRARRIRRYATLAPNPQNTGVHQIHPTAAIELIEAFHHVIRLARPGVEATIGGVTGPFAARHQRGHGPKPRFFGGMERHPGAQGAKGRDGVAGFHDAGLANFGCLHVFLRLCMRTKPELEQP